MTDRELLKHYAQTGASEPFAEISRRYTAMVYAACLRTLGNSSQAEDATQATFMVLLNKGRSLGSSTVLADWLHRTAVNCARNLRREELRRKKREQSVVRTTDMPENDSQWSAVSPLLHEALDTLPAQQREALTLRYLRGLSRAEIAAELNCPERTVESRLRLGVEKLREKLARMGVAVPMASFGVLLSERCLQSAPEQVLSNVLNLANGTAASSPLAISTAKGVTNMMFWQQVKVVATLMLCTSVALGGGGMLVSKLWAGENSKPPAKEPVKANAENLPYQDDPAILKQLDALGNNTSLVLPPFKMVGEEVEKWRNELYPFGPMLRGFSMKMPYVPDRHTAMYCGGSHNVPHKLCDMWELHLGSNTWNLVFPPDGGNQREKGDVFNPRDVDWIKANIVFKDGYLQTKRGGFLMPGHLWDGITYDPFTKKILWVNQTWGGPMGVPEALKNYAEITGQNFEELQKQARPLSGIWIFDMSTRKWQPQSLLPGTPQFDVAGSLLHLPDLKKSFWYCGHYQDHRRGSWLFDSATDTWQKLETQNGTSLDGKNFTPGFESVMAYSPKHKKIVAQTSKYTYVYDVQKNTWSNVAVEEKFKSDAHDASSNFVYDSVNDVFILIYNGMHVFSLTTNKWETITPAGAGLSKNPGPGYYDPRLNVMVTYPSDNSNTLWVYRFKK